MNFFLKTVLLFIITLSFTSCTDDLPIETNLGIFQNGYFITNEGPFNNGSGTITFVSDDNQVTQNIYQKINDESLGNIVQSMTLHNDNAYIVVNNSHKIVVVNRYTMKKITVIEGESINNPRNMVVINNTGYVSNWGNPSDETDDFIAVIDLNTNTVINTIAIGEGPEKMLVIDNKVYVLLQGGYGQNNKVEVINTMSNTIETTITVGDVPNTITKDTNGVVWVLCGGKPNWTGSETLGKLVKIENEIVINSFDFQATAHPNLLTIDNNMLYYHLNGKVYNFDINATELNTTEIEGLNGFYYTMTAHNGKLYTTNAGDFASEGVLKVFDLTNQTEINSFVTGIIPGSIVFQ